MSFKVFLLSFSCLTHTVYATTSTLKSNRKISIHEGSHSLNTQFPSETSITGKTWRKFLKYLITSRLDEINQLRLSRTLQLEVSFSSGHEAYLIDAVVKALEEHHINKKQLKDALDLAFQNRNVSRVILENLSRFDFFWHNSTRLSWNRTLDILLSDFPGTENATPTSDNASNSLFHKVLGKSNWFSRFITNREDLIVDTPNAPSQNLAAESNGLETAYRAQNGTQFGREKTNHYRFNHRLPVDESVVRTFLFAPSSTLANNGVEHTLGAVAKHWHNMLTLSSGNFAHQKMEQLDPFETLRFSMPAVLTELVALRGINEWDKTHLAAFTKKIELISPQHTVEDVLELVYELRDHIIPHVCGGVQTRFKPLRSWVLSIEKSLHAIAEEAKAVKNLLESSKEGILFGNQILSDIDWNLPSDKILKKSIYKFLKTGDKSQYSSLIQKALDKLKPKDKRTILSLFEGRHQKRKVSHLLQKRILLLTKREIQRSSIDHSINTLSRGNLIHSGFIQDEIYWIKDNSTDDFGVYQYTDHKTAGIFTHLESHKTLNEEDAIKLGVFIHKPVAKELSKAQKAWMNFELHHQKKFSANAFMEFKDLRSSLRTLQVLGQLQSHSIDIEKMNQLNKIKNTSHIPSSHLNVGQTYWVKNHREKSKNLIFKRRNFENKTLQFQDIEQKKSYHFEDHNDLKIHDLPPQSIMIIGGGPSGLLSTLHCLENVLHSGGEVSLSEKRDAFHKGGSAYERSQVVRLDPRWISMLRYHLGTSFEDVFSPLSGETQAHLGNSFPSLGFIELTIKDLEDLLQVNVVEKLSKGLLNYSTESEVHFDVAKNQVKKLGKHLKKGDRIFLDKTTSSWLLEEIIFSKSLSPSELSCKKTYKMYCPQQKRLKSYTLDSISSEKTYVFSSENPKEEIFFTEKNLPTLYENHVDYHSTPLTLTLWNEDTQERISKNFSDIKDKKFELNTKNTHVITAIGKPQKSTQHFKMTSDEPYGVCCLTGAKISLNMHRMGNKRWGDHLIDDIRSASDDNTRLFGDFTKKILTTSIIDHMIELSATDNWKNYIQNLIVDPSTTEKHSTLSEEVHTSLVDLRAQAPLFHRKSLQSRAFEIGDNSYLGMELPREYVKWRNQFLDTHISIDDELIDDQKISAQRLYRSLSQVIDRLFFQGALNVIHEGDVFNPGAKGKIPYFYLIDSTQEISLSNLRSGEAFIIKDEQGETKRYEILASSKMTKRRVLVRDMEGHVLKLKRNTRVFHAGDLSRSPDGEEESKVSIATFDVAHYVNNRSIHIRDKEKGYVYTPIGDEQTSPHFMRYSGLTGAAINAMEFNNFLESSLKKKPLAERLKIYSNETHWSNSEIVTRGIGAGYGEDGFLRPGFSYTSLLDYLYQRVLESMEYQEIPHKKAAQDILHQDWKDKISSGLIPRGLENNNTFLASLFDQLDQHLHDYIIEKSLNIINTSKQKDLKEAILFKRSTLRSHDLKSSTYWASLLSDLEPKDSETSKAIQAQAFIGASIEKTLQNTFRHIRIQASRGNRISSMALIQPKAVDSITDDFAVEAQGFADGLSAAAAFQATSLSIDGINNLSNTNTPTPMTGTEASSISINAASVLGAIGPVIAFGTITNASRYKRRNEDSQTLYQKTYLPRLKQSIFDQLHPNEKLLVSHQENPMITDFQEAQNKLSELMKYYGYTQPQDHLQIFDKITKQACDLSTYHEAAHEITTNLIPNTYHDQPYIKDTLLLLLSKLEHMKTSLSYEKKQNPPTEAQQDAKKLYHKIERWQDKLSNTIENEDVKLGWHRHRSLKHGHIAASAAYLWDTLRKRFNYKRQKTFIVETEDILSEIEALSQKLEEQQVWALTQEVHDLEHLLLATREVNKTSMIITSGWLTLSTGVAFTIGRLSPLAGSINTIASTAGGILGPIPAALSLHLLSKKQKLINNLDLLLTQKFNKDHQHLTEDEEQNIRNLQKIIKNVSIINRVRMAASSLAGVALPLNIIPPASVAALPLALTSVGITAGTSVALLKVEHKLRYKLHESMPEFICEAFREEIEDIHTSFQKESSYKNPKVLWEYTAREFLHQYRFDAIFAANRLGSILQYIQGGMRPLQEAKVAPIKAKRTIKTQPFTNSTYSSISYGDLENDFNTPKKEDEIR